MSLIDKTMPDQMAGLQDSPAAKARKWAEGQLSMLRAGSERRLLELTQRPREDLAAGNGAVGIGGPTVGTYVAFDIAATSPIQFGGPPPYQPGKVVAGGRESAFIIVFLWVNPVVSVVDGFAVPPTVQLAGRDWRIRLEELDLTNVAQGIDQTREGTFGSPADPLTFEIFELTPADPGVNPQLIEANITADIKGFVQPYSAFATTFFDVDDDPGFLFVPPAAPGFRHEVPNRYLVYSE